MTALDVAGMLKISTVVVPFYPGITSALGLLTTDLKYDYVKTELCNAADNPGAQLNADLCALTAQAHEQLARDGISEDQRRFEYAVDLRYVGQGYELRIPVAQTAKDEWNWQQAWESFHESHKTEYRHSFRDSPIEIATVRVTGKGLMPQLPASVGLRAAKSCKIEDARLKTGETYFRVGGVMKRLSTEFFDRASLPSGARFSGPAVLFQKDSTTVIPPGWSATVDDLLNVILSRESNA
jgi:N-methylhydantoinase A